MDKEDVTLDSISKEIAELFEIENKLVTCENFMSYTIDFKIALKKELSEKKKKIYEMREILIKKRVLDVGDRNE